MTETPDRGGVPGSRRGLLFCLLLTCLAVGGCAAVSGGGLDPRFVRRELGCRDASPGKRGESEELFTPVQGWDACVLLMHNGSPESLERERRGGTEVQLWRYGEGRVAVLEKVGCDGSCARGRSPWRVTHVRWAR